MSFRSLDDADVKGSARVLVRVDFNVPMHNGEVADVSRIEMNAPTITEIADSGGKVIIPFVLRSAREAAIRAESRSSPSPLRWRALSTGRSDLPDGCVGEVAEQAVAAMKPGEILCRKIPAFTPAKKITTPRLPRSWPSSGMFMSTTPSRSRTARTPPLEAIARLLRR